MQQTHWWKIASSPPWSCHGAASLAAEFSTHPTSPAGYTLLHRCLGPVRPSRRLGPNSLKGGNSCEALGEKLPTTRSCGTFYTTSLMTPDVTWCPIAQLIVVKIIIMYHVGKHRNTNIISTPIQMSLLTTCWCDLLHNLSWHMQYTKIRSYTSTRHN